MFTKTNSQELSRTSVFIYGESGLGKTQLVKTLDHKRTLIINVENGLIGLRGCEIDVYDVTVDKDGVPMDRNFRFEKLLAVLNMLNGEEYKKKYDNIFIDSFTEVSQCFVEYLKLKYPDRKDSLLLWGENKSATIGLAKSLRDFAPYNVFITALEETEKDEMGRRFPGINVAGSASQEIPAIFDEVLNLQMFPTKDGGEVRKLVTSSFNNYKCKDRSGTLEKFEEPDLTIILNKILNKENENV